MIIDIARLSEGGERFKGEEPPSILEMGDDPVVRFDGPLEYDLNAYLAANDLVIGGSLVAKVSLKCCRCAEFFGVTLEDKAFQHVLELSQDIESVDLTDEIREAMLLLFPPYPVCRGECMGLCAQCGANLNETECQCEKPADVRWGGLDELNIQ
jgi:uncharacterized protein